MLRTVLRDLVGRWPRNVPLIFHGMDTLFKGVAIRARISGTNDADPWKGASAVLQDIRDAMAAGD